MKIFDSVLIVMVILTAGFSVLTYYKVCNMENEKDSENKPSQNESE